MADIWDEVVYKYIVADYQIMQPPSMLKMFLLGQCNTKQFHVIAWYNMELFCALCMYFRDIMWPPDLNIVNVLF